MRRFALVVGVTMLVSATPAGAGARFPERIDLPSGFFPEGIDIARGANVYVGSIPTGAVWRGDLRTGQGAVQSKLPETKATPAATILPPGRTPRRWLGHCHA